MQKQLTIATARDLLDALNHPEMPVRAATLKAVAANPEKASSVCRAEGIDLFSELTTLFFETPDAGLRAGYLFALLNMDDERCITFAKEQFLETDDAKIILLTAEQIAKLPEQERIDFLVPVVMAGDLPTKRRAAANLLVGCGGLKAEVVLRIALISDHDVPPPPLDAETLEIWLAELQGPFRRSAQKLLSASSAAGFSGLLACWKRLPDPVRIWVLREWSQHMSDHEADRIRDIIRTADGDVLLHALSCLQSASAAGGDEDLLCPLYAHEDACVRAAAFGAGSKRLDWAAVLGREKSEEVRLAVINRMQRSEDSNAIHLLAALVQDPSWRIRSRATKALTAFAPASLPALRDMLSHQSENVRVAAVQALNALGQQEWINDPAGAALHKPE